MNQIKVSLHEIDLAIKDISYFIITDGRIRVTVTLINGYTIESNSRYISDKDSHTKQQYDRIAETLARIEVGKYLNYVFNDRIKK